MNQSPWANYHSLNVKHTIKLTPYSDESRTSTLKHAQIAPSIGARPLFTQRRAQSPRTAPLLLARPQVRPSGTRASPPKTRAQANQDTEPHIPPAHLPDTGELGDHVQKSKTKLEPPRRPEEKEKEN